MKKKLNKVFITGINSGLGLNLSEIFKSHNYEVFSFSKSKNKSKKNIRVNFSNLKKLEQISNSFFRLNNKYDYIFLNAGILGSLKKINLIKKNEIDEIMNINFLSNKIIIDSIIKNKVKFKSIIAISSGASLNPKHSWFLYCLSKVSFRFLIESYSIEYPKLHLINFNPGPMNTMMQEKVRSYDVKKIPSVKIFKTNYKNNKIPDPKKIARLIFDNLDFITKEKSGAYLDARYLKKN